MGSAADSLGTIAVDIVGDYSQLQADLDAAAAQAAQAGADIAGAFTGAADSYNEFSDAAQGVIDRQAALDAAAEQALSTWQELQTRFEEGSVSAETLARAEEELDAATKAASASAEESSAAWEHFEEIGAELLAGLGLIETVKSLIEVTGQIQLATVSLTALTGSAEVANETLAQLREMADSDALSFPALVEANQRMVAMGFSADAIPGALQAAADAAAALNTTIDNTSAAMDRMALSGMANQRQLVNLGLSTKDLADAMGVTEAQAKATFAILDESTRLQVLTVAIENVKEFAGLAQKTAETIPGQWQQIKNAFETAAQSAGDFFQPVIGWLTTWLKQLGQAIDLLTRLAHATGRFVIGEGFNLPATAPGGTTPEENSTTTISPSEQAAGLQMVVAQQKAVADAAAMTTIAVKSVKAITDDYTSSLAIAVEIEKDHETALKNTSKAIAAYGAYLENAGIDLTDVDVKQAYFNEQMFQAAISVGKFADLAPAVGTFKDQFGQIVPQLDMVVVGTQTLGKEAEKVLGLQVPDSISDVNKAYKTLGLTIDQVTGDLETKQVAAYQKVATSGVATLGSLNESWAKISGQVSKLALTDMPKAVALYDEQIAKAQALGASEGELLKLVEAKNQAEITGAEQTGADATEYVVALQNAKIQTQLLIDKSTDLGNLYVGLTNIVTNLWQDFASGVSDAIANSKNFGDAMLSVLKKIEQQILDQLVGYAFKQLENSLLQATGMFKSLGTTAQNAAQQAAGAVSGGGGGGAAGGVASLAGGGGPGGALGGLTSLGGLGAIGSIVGAISGIVSNIQQSHANKVLGEIELNTRQCFNVLAQMQGSLTGQGPYASLAAQMATSGPALATAAGGAGGGGAAINFNNCTFSGLTQDMVNALFASALRQFKAAGG